MDFRSFDPQQDKREIIDLLASGQRRESMGGHVFIAVKSTRIYCRPTCCAKMPKYENITLYPSVAQAEEAGYRPCLLCRPECSPGLAPSGLLLAKNLLTETTLDLGVVAQAAGFKGAQQLQEALQAKYRLTAEGLRKKKRAVVSEGCLAVSLGYRPPYDWDRMLEFLAMRVIPGVEAVEGGAYLRTVRLQDRAGADVFGWLRVTRHPRKPALRLEASLSLAPVFDQVVTRCVKLFDLGCDPDLVQDGLRSMSQLGPQLPYPGLRVPGCFDSFEMAVRAVLGQQITVKAASTLAGRVAKTLGQPLPEGLSEDAPCLTHVFPTAQELLDLGDSFGDALGQLGVTRMRQKTIHALAEGMVDGSLDFAHADPEEMIKRLNALPGIGNWTANYLTMRMMAYTDAFPATDLGVIKALGIKKEKDVIAAAQGWRPYRAYATLNLWNKEVEAALGR